MARRWWLDAMQSVVAKLFFAPFAALLCDLCG
jgi:hypothetical protein